MLRESRAVHPARQVDIGEHHIHRFIAGEISKRVRGIGNRMDGESVFGQSLADHFRDEDFILDHENEWNLGNDRRRHGTTLQNATQPPPSERSHGDMCPKCRKFNRIVDNVLLS